MFLKSLEIRGFKSFADKTELNFKKGVTAVVGPNGSGKSNISDSVRWVLGEQSVKTLRGGKMEDVIFAGTQYRKPVGLAQVSLTLDNQDGFLQIEYNEVKVKRRIFRSGETEYLINGSKCRLKDITNLFMDTGIGKEGYSLIGQGKIEAILSGKPEERRALLEEAAGIVKYKARKEEAEKKLNNTDDNLVRIRDIISTYEERLEPLKLEREKALKYKEISDDLKEKEVSLSVHFINDIEKQLKEYNIEIDKRTTQLNEKKEKLLTYKNNLNDLKREIDEVEKRNSDNKNEFYNKKEHISELSNEILVLQEKIKNCSNLITKNTLELEELKGKIEILQKEKVKLESDLEESQKEQKSKEEEINSYIDLDKQGNLEIQKLENKIKALKEDQFELLKGHSDIKNAISLIENDIKIKKEKEDILNSSLNTTKGNIKINIATLEVLKEKVKSNEEKIKTIENGIILKKKNIGSLNGQISRLDNELRILNKKINEIEANKNMLSNLEKHYEGYNRAVKVLMDNIAKGLTPKALGTKVLGEVFKVDKKYETAIEIALGGAISNVITEDEQIAKNLINYLKKNNLGRATFLPLNTISGNKIKIDDRTRNIKGFIGIASECIDFDKKYLVAINNVLGRTIIAQDMDSALNISRSNHNSLRIVTLSGEIIAPGGALTGGSISKRFTNILGRKREIEELGIELNKKKNELEVSNKKLQELRNKLKALDEEILNDRDDIHFIGIEKAKNESEIKNLKNEYEKLNISLKNYERDMTKNKEDIEKLHIDYKNKEKDLENLEGKNIFNKDKTLEYEKTLDEKKKKIQEVKDKITELKVKKASFDEIITNKMAEVFRKGNEVEEYQIKVSDLEDENSRNSEEINKHKEKISLNELTINKEKGRLEELENLFKDDEIKKTKLKEEENKFDTIISELSEIINKADGDLNKREISKAKVEMEKDNLYTKLNEELELTLAEAKEIAIEVDDVNKFKDNISKLKGRITALGTVNLAAINEYEEVKEKYEFMHNQEQDLENAKKELISVIDELTENMRILFKDNFKILNENFNETFRELFKGGRAELILGEGDELSASIDINVEPPGKKLQNINLMSGGEKVLSAIALMFAILKMKPTPFCILDEIEAALDDANVYRYAEFLKEFSKNIQFIVITHRKGTMEAADVMYGVTMQEKGISKVVSVDLTKN